MTNSLNAPLARLIAGQICLHACMAGMRMAAPLLALQQGYSAAAVGVLLALFALTQVFLALPAGGLPTAMACDGRCAGAWAWPFRVRRSRWPFRCIPCCA
jgi:hypothetical protein